MSITDKPVDPDERPIEERDPSILHPVSRLSIRFTLSEIEEALGFSAGLDGIDLQGIEEILHRSLTFDELTRLVGDRFVEMPRILRRTLHHEELLDLLNGNSERMKTLLDAELNRQKEEEIQQLPIHRLRSFERILRE